MADIIYRIDGGAWTLAEGVDLPYAIPGVGAGNAVDVLGHTAMATVEAVAGLFVPADLFGASEEGAVYDPQDLGTLWQDEAGTVAVTAAGQTVKRIDDISGNGNHCTTATTGFTLQQDAFGKYYLLSDGTAIMSSGTVYPSLSAWPSIAGAIHSGSIAGYPFAVLVAGQDRLLALQQGTSANNRAGIWKRGTVTNLLQVETGYYSGHLTAVCSINSAANTIYLNGFDKSYAGGDNNPPAGDYVVNIGGLNDLTPNMGVCRFYGGVTIGRQLTAQEISDLDEYYAANSPVGGLKSAAVFLNIGQSNMIGRDTSDATDHAAYTVQWDYDEGMLDATSPLNHVNPDAGDMGLDVTFSIDHRAAVGGNIVFIPYAQGGTGFVNNYWNKGDVLYEAAVAHANRFHLMYGNAIDAILWHQGESDSGNAGYQTALDTFIADVRSDLLGASATTPLLLGGLVPDFIAASGANAAIQAIIEDTPNRVSATYYVSSAGLTDLGDDLHFSAASIKTLGERYYAAYEAI